MRWIQPLSAAALLAIPAIAFAQPMGAEGAGAMPSGSSGGSYGAGASTSSTGAGSITPGLPVKDKTGASIGSVAEVKTDTSGKKVATIKMGADSFAVDTSALAVQDGAAVINASQAEIKSMLSKAK
jgi:hypothetical protein